MCTSAGKSAVMGHALDLDPAPAGHRHVHVLAGRADASTHLPARPRDVGDQPPAGLEFVRRAEVGFGHDLGERHAEPIRAERNAMADVRHLAAGVFFERELTDAQLAVQTEFGHAKGDNAGQSQHRGALEPRRNRAVEVLLAHHVQLGDQVQVEESETSSAILTASSSISNGGVSSIS